MNRDLQRRTTRNFILIGLGIVVYIIALAIISAKLPTYRVIFQTSETQYTFEEASAQPWTVDVTIKNRSNKYIDADAGNYLTYHLFDTNGACIAYENQMTPLTQDIFNMNKSTETMEIAKLPVGEYELQLELYQSNVAWYTQQNTDNYWIHLTVQ